MWRAQCQCLIEGGRSHTNVIATTPHIQLATMKKSVAPFLVYHHTDHHTALHQVAKCRQGHMGRKRHIAATERHERETRTSCISVARRHHPHKTSREPNTLQPALRMQAQNYSTPRQKVGYPALPWSKFAINAYTKTNRHSGRPPGDAKEERQGCVKVGFCVRLVGHFKNAPTNPNRKLSTVFRKMSEKTHKKRAV